MVHSVYLVHLVRPVCARFPMDSAPGGSLPPPLSPSQRDSGATVSPGSKYCKFKTPPPDHPRSQACQETGGGRRHFVQLWPCLIGWSAKGGNEKTSVLKLKGCEALSGGRK